MKKEIRKLIQSVIYIGMGLQIILGVVWIGCNLGNVPRFEESAELITMSETLCVDEYTGILYPVSIRLAMLLEKWLGIAGCVFLYVLQIGVAYAAYGYFLKKVVCGKKEMNGQMRNRVRFFAGFAITIPAVLQCHMAILPYSLASSVFLVFVAQTVDLWRKDSTLTGKQIFTLGALWVISALLSPDYAWISGLAAGISILRYMQLHKQFSIKLVAMFVSAVLCINLCNAGFQQEGSMGKIQKSVGSAMLLRCVWPNFSKFQFFWKPEVLALWDEAGLADLSNFPEKVIYEFGPTMEQVYGKKRANEIYWDMVETSIGLDTKNILKNVISDGVAYICPPLSMLIQLQGVGVSYTGWNYGRMKDYTPLLTEYYVDYALMAWVYLWVLCLVWGAFSLRKRSMAAGQKQSGKREWIGAYLCSVSIWINVWYVMSSGSMQDYKKLIVNSILWVFLLVRILQKGEEISE